MPTYSYKCKKCNKVFDVFHSISASPRVKCEDCGGSTSRLMGTGAGIIFKGSGFYETDYKRSGGGADSKSGDSTSSESKSTESKSTDSKGSGDKPQKTSDSKKSSGSKE